MTGSHCALSYSPEFLRLSPDIDHLLMSERVVATQRDFWSGVISILRIGACSSQMSTLPSGYLQKKRNVKPLSRWIWKIWSVVFLLTALQGTSWSFVLFIKNHFHLFSSQWSIVVCMVLFFFIPLCPTIVCLSCLSLSTDWLLQASAHQISHQTIFFILDANSRSIKNQPCNIIAVLTLNQSQKACNLVLQSRNEWKMNLLVVPRHRLHAFDTSQYNAVGPATTAVPSHPSYQTDTG